MCTLQQCCKFWSHPFLHPNRIFICKLSMVRKTSCRKKKTFNAILSPRKFSASGTALGRSVSKTIFLNTNYILSIFILIDQRSLCLVYISLKSFAYLACFRILCLSIQGQIIPWQTTHSAIYSCLSPEIKIVMWFC